MRNIFLALVLANLAFAAWHNWFSIGEQPARVADANVPGITLASEISSDEPTTEDPTEVTGSTATSAAGADISETSRQPAVNGLDVAVALDQPAEPSADRERCVSVGPFRELSQVVNAGANLRAAGYDPEQRVAEGDIWVGYWVYIEGIPTREEADQILSALRENGISDSYVIPGTESGNLVSLGVFSEISRDGSRREEARSVGHAVTISDRTRRGTVYWIDVLLSIEQELDFDLLQTPGRIIRLEQRPCDDAPA